MFQCATVVTVFHKSNDIDTDFLFYFKMVQYMYEVKNKSLL